MVVVVVVVVVEVVVVAEGSNKGTEPNTAGSTQASAASDPPLSFTSHDPLSAFCL